MNNKLSALMSFLDTSPTPYHVIRNLATELEGEGYIRLSEKDEWKLESGGKYYFTRGGSSMVAFRVPTCEPAGFMMSACHSDHPTFKLKENGELVGIYTRLSTEKYGGMLIAPWLDRPLSVAGRVLAETDDGIESKLVNIDRDLLMIPNLAIHMNRKANEGVSWNPAVDTLPLLGGRDAAGKLNALLEEMAGGKILGHDLYLYIRQKAVVWGMDNEFLSAAALDDLDCVWGCFRGFLEAQAGESIPLLCVFDSEEVGSNSVQGADSTILQTVLGRICDALGLSLPRMLARSFMVSADNAQAIHPNHPELADPANAPVPNGGVVLKFNASQRYTTDGVSAAVFRKICARADVPVQVYYNRADIPGGSTLGYLSLHHVSVPTADIGLAQLAMHSCYETAGAHDPEALEKAMAAYYASSLDVTENGFTVK